MEKTENQRIGVEEIPHIPAPKPKPVPEGARCGCCDKLATVRCKVDSRPQCELCKEIIDTLIVPPRCTTGETECLRVTSLTGAISVRSKIAMTPVDTPYVVDEIESELKLEGKLTAKLELDVTAMENHIAIMEVTVKEIKEKTVVLHAIVVVTPKE